MMKKCSRIICRCAKETRKLGEKLAEKILAQGLKSPPAGRAIILALQGDLGGGKTTFLQGFAKGLGIKEKVLSPTFVILKCFKITKSQIPSAKSQTNSKSKILNSKFTNFYHFDCYRIKNAKEILELGFKEIISNPKNIVAVEWPERIRKILPKSVIVIKFDFIDKNKREVMMKNF
ncbi:MAG: UPF0079 ATP-binding protein [Parcubacteria group bacterium Licking1014_1]|nr:MAG: UPF0079 ATP-binding protein [Parcubacteria group bacterium Licking1014_1]